MTAFAFCETAAAVHWHIRKVTDAGKIFGRHTNDYYALCGAKAAWDLQTDVEHGRTYIKDDRLCFVCVREYEKRKHTARTGHAS